MTEIQHEEERGHVRWYHYNSGLSVPEIECRKGGELASGLEISPFDSTVCWECCDEVTDFIEREGVEASKAFDRLRAETGRFLEPPEAFEEWAADDEADRLADFIELCGPDAGDQGADAAEDDDDELDLGPGR